MTSSLRENEESLVKETYCSDLGTVLLLIREIHFEAKKLLKYFALISKSDSSLLLISRGGIIGTFFSSFQNKPTCFRTCTGITKFLG